MKKYLLILFLIIIFVPSVTSASWWNPFSWKVFSRPELVPKEEQVEVQKTPEEKIEELQKQLDDLKKEQPSPVLKTGSPVVKEVKKAIPVIDNSAIIKAQEEAIIEKKKAEALLEYHMVEEQASVEALKAESDRQAQLEADKIRLATEKENQKLLKAQEEADAKIASKQKKLNAINLKIANLNAKYAKETADIKKNFGGTSFGLYATLSNMETKYTDEYNALMAEFQQVQYSE